MANVEEFEKKVKEDDYRNIEVSSLMEFVAFISAIKKYFIQVLYRGQASSKWPVVSSAYRKLESSLCGQSATDATNELLKYHKSLIHNSRQLYDSNLREKEVNDMRLLAYAQHHGAKTNLIDFSENPLVALWFACQKEACDDDSKEERYARVVWVKKDLEVVDENKNRVGDLFKDDGLTLYKFTAPFFDRRLVVQQSVFIIAPNGEIKSKDYNTIRIPAGCKKSIIEELSYLGISQKTIYPDFEGFTQWFDYTGKDRIDDLLDEAKTLYEKKDYEGALSNYLEVLKLAEMLWGENDARTAIIYAKVGMNYGDLSKYTEAIEYSKKALYARISVFGETHLVTANSFQQMGVRFRESDRFSEALGCYSKALTARTKILGENHADVAIVYNNLGECYRYLGDFDSALSTHTKALTIRKTIYSKYGDNHRSIAITYANLSRCHIERCNTTLSDDSLAKEYAYKSLAIRQTLFTPENIFIANSLVRCAEYENTFGDSNTAICLLDKALEIRSKNSQDDDNRTPFGTIYLNFGIAFSKTNDSKKALDWLDKALEVYRKIYGDNHSETARVLESIGEALSETGETMEALSRFQNAYDIYMRVFGADSTRTAKALSFIENLDN